MISDPVLEDFEAVLGHATTDPTFRSQICELLPHLPPKAQFYNLLIEAFDALPALEITRVTFNDFLKARRDVNPMERAAQMAIYNRCRLHFCKTSEVPGKITLVAQSFRAAADKAAVVESMRDAQAFNNGKMSATECILRNQRRLSNLANNKTKAKLQIATMASIEEKLFDWLYPGMIPLGGITVFGGEGEAGKSTLVSDFMARLSNGSPWPDGTPSKPGGVLYVGVEEDVNRVLRPRLRFMGANLEKIFNTSGKTVIGQDGDAKLVPFTFEDIDALRTVLIENPDVRAVVFDPLGCFFGSQKDSYKDQDINPMLQALNHLAQDTHTAMILIAHLGKGEKSSIKNRILGSVAIPNTARSVIGVIKDKSENSAGYFGIVKANFPGNRRTKHFRFVPDPDYVPDPTGATVQLATISYDADLDTDLESLARTAAKDGGDGRGSEDREVAKQLITSTLANGPVSSAQMKERCRVIGISESTALRAAQELGVNIGREERFGGPRTTWSISEFLQKENENDSPF